MDRLETVKDPVDNVSTYTYDSVGNLVSLVTVSDGITLNSFTYTYANNGIGIWNQTSKTEIVNETNRGTTTYGYDALSRLTSVTHPDGVQNTYTYDGAGNRLTKTSAADGQTAVNTYAYDVENRLQSVTAAVAGTTVQTTYYTYDPNGNQLARWSTSPGTTAGEEGLSLELLGTNATSDTALYEYDNFNRLVGIIQGSTVIQNTYSGDGKNIERSTNDEVTKYVYDGNTVINELDDQNALVARNVYGRNLISRTVGTQNLVFAYNGHGDVVSLADSAGVLVEYTYDEFGNIVSEEYAENVTDIDNPYRYAGYEYLEDVALYDLNARYYDPSTARFLSADPYFDLGNRVMGLYEINVPNVNSIMQANALYAYCGNNPVIYIDQSGEIFFLVTAAAGALIGGISGAIYSQVKYGEVRWQNVAAGAAIGGVVGATGGAATAYITTGSAVASTSVVVTSLGSAGVAAASSVPVLKDLYDKVAPHMFSKDHIRNGIMNLGKDQISIFNDVVNIVNSYSTKWVAGSNEIHTIINGIETTIRFRVTDGILSNVNAFVGYSERVVGNLIK